MDTTPWTLAVARPRQEAKAADNCRRQGLQVVAPRLRDSRVFRGRVVPTESFLFPGYLFVQLVGDHVYGMLRNTIGVGRVLLMAGQPATCSAQLVYGLQQRMDQHGFIDLPRVAPPPAPVFTAGQRVRVVQEDHVLFGYRGVCAGMDARQRVSVLLSIMGRKVPVLVEQGALAAA